MKSGLGRHDVQTASWRWIARAFVLFLCGTVFLGCGPKKDAAEVQKQLEATRDLGVALMSEGRSRAALREFLRAEELDPKDSMVQDYLGIVLLTLHRPEEAIDHFEKALKLDPEFSNARNNLGSAYLAMKRWDDAIKVYEKLMADLTYPTPWMPAAGLGWAYYNKGNYKNSEEYYLMSVDQSPGFAIGWRGLGKVYMATGKYEKASMALEKAVSFAPNFSEAHFDLGEVHFRAGRRSLAIQSFQKVCELSPDTDLCQRGTSKIQTIRSTW